MKNKKILIFLLLIIGIGIIGFTGAYFINNMQLENEFNTSEYGATFNEIFESPNDWEPGDVTEKIVYASNNGDADIAVRISYQELWESADGTELANTQDGKSIAVVNLVHTNDWVKIGNYYYYKYRLKKNDRTSDFMKSVTFNDEVDFSVNCEFLNTYYAGNCSYTTGDYYGATYTLNITIETIQFDNYKDIWGSNIDLLDNKPLTGVEKLVQKSNPSSVTNYNDGVKQEMYAFDHAVTGQTPVLTDYRYIGNDPYNYVYFNCDEPQEGVEYNYATSCEVWRILGVFSVDDGTGYTEQRMKLVRGNEFSTKMEFNSIENNDWTVSPLNTFLNEAYYNRSGVAATYGLKNSTHNMIGEAVFYLGAISKISIDSYNYNYGSTEKIYGEERGNALCGACNNTITKQKWVGRVALMYPSDQYMVYGNGVNETCYENPKNCYGPDGWVYNSNIMEEQSDNVYTWFISSRYNHSYYELYSHSNSHLDSHLVGSGYINGVRPVVYLNSDVMIESGTGQENDPYVLSY